MNDEQSKIIGEFLTKIFVSADKSPLSPEIEKALDILEDETLKHNGIAIID